MKFNYLTEKEAEMSLDMALLQLALGLQYCKTKSDVIELLKDAVELGRREKVQMQKSKALRIQQKQKLLCTNPKDLLKPNEVLLK